MATTPVDLIERLRTAGDDASADTVADIARALAMVKRYFEELRGVVIGGESPDSKCLEAVDEALDRIRHPL